MIIHCFLRMCRLFHIDKQKTALPPQACSRMTLDELTNVNLVAGAVRMLSVGDDAAASLDDVTRCKMRPNQRVE